MKQFALAISMLLVLSANKCNNAAADTAATLKDKKWIMQTLMGEPLGLPPGMEQPWLQLAGDQVQGFGGCNALMGSYTMDGSALNFLGVGSTKKYCEGIQPTETAIMEMLTKVESFKMDKTGLKLFGGSQELATLESE
ncbi:MAG: META domain-containing protein [Flavobacteriales bacterium]